MTSTTTLIPQAFIWRRLHSLAGIWLTGFIIIHLLTNSQAALFFGHDGRGFISSANSLESLPFLPVLEILILGVPIFIHMVWGVKYLLTMQANSFPTNGATPALPEYGRNRAYTWQRVTAWLLILGILAHVVHMRFLERPKESQVGSSQYYIVRLNDDEGLYTLAERLNFTVLNQADLEKRKTGIKKSIEVANPQNYDHAMLLDQRKKQSEEFLKTLEKKPLKKGQVLAIAPDFGTADLLMVRDTFKSPVMIFLYTILVWTACYHAFNGLWTFLIKWGVTLTRRSQFIMLRISIGLMLIVGFLGLAAVWGTYWINLRY